METLILFILVFSGMIILHELGHFAAAKFFKIPVEEFGLGLPPRVFTLFRWQGTDFTLNLLPLGGFVRPRGENDPDTPDGLAAANPWKRLVVLVAGPLMNLLTAVIVFSILVAQVGIAIPGQVLIGDVLADSPAALSGIQAGDLLVKVAGEEISTSQQAVELIRSYRDIPVEIVLLRDGQQITVTPTPLSSRTPEEGALGISLGAATRPASLPEAIGSGVVITAGQAVTILYIPVGLIQGMIAPEEARLVGLRGMYDFFGAAVERDSETREQAAAAEAAGQAAEQPSNWVLSLIGMLSVSLGVFNLLPIPALDGGRILFTLPEILFKRRIPARLENVINGVAFMVLIGLMLLINVMDFINPVNVSLP